MSNTSVQTEPKASRPVMPGYGVPETLEGTLPWTHVSDRLASAKNYWVVTASADGRPHAVPVWAIWLDGVLYFGAGPRSARNLAENPRVSIHLERGDDVVIIEGTAEAFSDPDGTIFPKLADATEAKYEWRPDAPYGNVLRPKSAYAWTSFPADATRWQF